MTAESLNDFHAGVFGRELDSSITPARVDIVERLREQGSNRLVAETVGSIKRATGARARHSPATKAYDVLASMLMFFKRFLVKSLHQRLMRGINDARLNSRAMDQAFTAALMVLGGGAYYASSAC